MRKQRRKVIRYSESFKLQVLGELERGDYGSPHEAGRHYGIRGETISRWAERFGKNQLLAKVVRVENPDEQSELKRLRERVKQLEKVVADQYIAHEIDKSYLEIACERAGIQDVSKFKKKAAGKMPGARSSGNQKKSR